jgi:hypothetical protein
MRLAVRKAKFTPDGTTRSRIARYFPVLVDPERARKYGISTRTFEALLPKTMEKYYKIQILAGGDKMRGNESTSIDPVSNRRDASFVRVSRLFSQQTLTHL